MARRRKSSWRVRATLEQMEAIAPLVLGEPFMALTAGYTLTKGSGVWRRANGTYTVRLVYRGTDDGDSSRTFTVRGVAHHTLLNARQAA